LVDTALAARDELEVLHRVGHVEFFAIEAGLDERAIEHFARGPHERRPAQILLVTRLLADEHDARVGRATAEDRLGGVTEEIAALAAGRRLLQRLEAAGGGNERTRAAAFGLELQHLLLLRPFPLAPGTSRQREEAADVAVVRLREQVAALADETPEDRVERRPARGVAARRRLARDVEELTGNAHGAGLRASQGSAALGPRHVHRRDV